MDPRALMEAVRRACVQAATEAYEQGGMSGLCAEGRFELAIGAIQQLELDGLLESDLKEPTLGEEPG